jgi:hypothetical protein
VLRAGRAGAASLPLLLLLAGCGSDFLGHPPRVKSDGYRAVASITEEGATRTFEVAVRGGDVRRELAASAAWPVLVTRSSPPRAFELDPAGKRYRELDPARVPPVLAELPLAPGFSEHQEAGRRGLTEYYRESDTVFAGNACQLWRFEDRPQEPDSPSTTFWVAPSLDGLVVRLDWEIPGAAGARWKKTIELRNVRPGAKPDLFEVPAGYAKAPAPEAGSPR